MAPTLATVPHSMRPRTADTLPPCLGTRPATSASAVPAPRRRGVDPLLEKVEGVCVVGNNIVLTYDNDFNVAEVASTPANRNPEGPLVQLELVGANFPRIYVIPMQ